MFADSHQMGTQFAQAQMMLSSAYGDLTMANF